MFQQEPQRIRPRQPRPHLPVWASYGLMGLFVVAIVGLGYLVFTGVRGLVMECPFGNCENPLPPILGGGAAATQTAASVGGDSVWTGGRVTVLAMGIDERQTEQGPWRTDTMILMTIDPAAQRAGMLSIPRDLWVEIPVYGAYDRINTAHFRGDADQYPGGGGPALAMLTVQQNFGVPVDFFVTINFRAFVQTVDLMGCVPIDVPVTIDDPTYPAEDNGFDPFYIEAGHHCLDGETLLKYARTRATFGSDFDRAARQQDVIYAIRDHVLSTGQFPNLLAQAPQIYATVEGGVNTNLSLDQLVALAQLASEIPRENICSRVIDGTYIEDLQTLADGSQVLVPDRDAVRQLALDVVNGTGQCAPGAEDLAALALAEGATVSLFNGTQQEGLASETGDMLAAFGINIITLGNAERFDYSQTIIYNYAGKDGTARYLAQLLGVPETAITVAERPLAETADIRVILGSDYGQ